MKDFGTRTTPKVVSEDDGCAAKLVAEPCGAVIERVVSASSTPTAEADKLMGNIFRAVNIASVSELKTTYERIRIDI